MHITPAGALIVVLTGLVSGFLNAVASSGSAVSLPILMWTGLHAINADATNRIPVLVGAMSSVVGLARRGAIPWRRALLVSTPATLGSVIGALFAESLPSHDIRIGIVGAVVVTLALLLTKLNVLLKSAAPETVRLGTRPFVMLFLVGIWAGLIGLSATYTLLVLVLAMRIPVVEANAIKIFVLVPVTAVAMMVFAEKGSIDWSVGGVMALGSVAGGLLGARLAVSEQARRWIVGLLVLVTLAELIHLLVQYFFHLRIQ
ncbi:sulfite exporter TauE/SafE family protein [Paraburkholderia strydomiana]|uniref:sulfite exporter TauE/SafE family protein n=1 Tax=Paraburkholderia strydomiana TaxID=1245417 RepID=UPI0028588161|nr:sulfite exporter TauE/SafE family protein [Paraburkholderia strydomiana]MDR7006198.1 putative membrane protein YfcA [Paraburkholderia strydomiana]